MKKEEIVDAMLQLEANSKVHSETQLDSYTKMLEQYMSSMDLFFGQMHQKLQEVSGNKWDSQDLATVVGESPPSTINNPQDMSAYLKGFSFDLPKFHGEDVHNRIYLVQKYFTLHSVPIEIRLNIVAFQLEVEVASWYQWMDRNGALKLSCSTSGMIAYGEAFSTDLARHYMDNQTPSCHAYTPKHATGPPTTPSLVPVPTQPLVKVPLRSLSLVEIQEKCNKGLCFSCDEKYDINHCFKNCVMVLMDMDGKELDVLGSTDTLIDQPLMNEEEMEVSLHTLTNVVNSRIF